MRDEDGLVTLLRRFNHLGRLLPAPDALDTDSPTEVGEAQVILAEMAWTKRQIDALLGRPTKEG